MGSRTQAEGRKRLYDHDPRQANNEVQDPRQKEKKRDLGSGTQAEGRTSMVAQEPRQANQLAHDPRQKA
ncbi:MAG TPA: hypothetical protein PLX41_06990 [Bacteroidales bacterium]|nr:hypothetical protein [Bacteroidales bacterium]